jgi:hypothetical protein
MEQVVASIITLYPPLPKCLGATFQPRRLNMANPFPDKDKKNVLITFLRMIGGVKVVVNFQGGGDSGEVSDAQLFDKHEKTIDITKSKLDWSTEKDVFKDGVWVTETEQNFVVANDILVSATETMLENEGLDWYNNEGGEGSLTIDLTTEPPTMLLDVSINRMEYDNYEFDYTNPEEGDEDAPAPSR